MGGIQNKLLWLCTWSANSVFCKSIQCRLTSLDFFFHRIVGQFRFGRDLKGFGVQPPT